ncbi:unnamed protein product, partial [Phaeothamnion confervicola]
ILAGAAVGGGAAAAGTDDDGDIPLAAVAGAVVGGLLCQEREEPPAAPVEPAPAPPPAPPPPPPPPPPPAAPATGTVIESLQGTFFDFDKSTLRPQAGPKLDHAADVMNEHPGIKLSIQGHTDNVGADAYNQKLSERRAQAVFDYLVGKGIDASRLMTIGYGESRPAVSNDTAEGRAQNRRTELIVAE